MLLYRAPKEGENYSITHLTIQYSIFTNTCSAFHLCFQQYRTNNARLISKMLFQTCFQVGYTWLGTWEILGMALPASLAVAADPIASLIDTAFIGHIGNG